MSFDIIYNGYVISQFFWWDSISNEERNLPRGYSVHFKGNCGIAAYSRKHFATLKETMQYIDNLNSKS